MATNQEVLDDVQKLRLDLQANGLVDGGKLLAAITELRETMEVLLVVEVIQMPSTWRNRMPGLLLRLDEIKTRLDLGYVRPATKPLTAEVEERRQQAKERSRQINERRQRAAESKRRQAERRAQASQPDDELVTA